VPLKLLIEGWAQKIRIYSRADKVPVATRAFLTSRKLDSHFSSFRASGHEAKLLENLAKESTLWQLMLGHTAASFLFDGKQIYDATGYPSYKNINRLFSRLGISNIGDLIGKKLHRDTETLIEGFQSVRTALAHSEPPIITIQDVEAKLEDMRSLIGAIDKIFYKHVVAYSGSDCWL